VYMPDLSAESGVVGRFVSSGMLLNFDLQTVTDVAQENSSWA
jgi:hypothetical protein